MKRKKPKFDYQKYLAYLKSSAWLIKKSKLVMQHVKRGWKISCIFCEDTNNLQVHHLTYDTLYNEPLEDLTFLCATCHKRTYNDKANFKKEWQVKSDKAFEWFNQHYDVKK